MVGEDDTTSLFRPAGRDSNGSVLAFALDGNEKNPDDERDTGENGGVSSPPSLDDLRQMGNHHFSQGDYDQALLVYDLAVERSQREKNLDAVIVNLSNRSACLFKMERYEDANNDAEQAVKASKGRNAKASYRLGKTQIQLQQYAQAVECLQAALSEKESDATAGQRKALTDLLQEAETRKPKEGMKEKIVHLFSPSSIQFVKRPISIKEFDVQRELGIGNFSEIHSCTHKKTGEEFALKLISKKKAADLAKRQHPNVYNEIQMERRVLLERLPDHVRIVKMFHTFQDYNSVYYLMGLHTENPDLWSTLRYKKKMVGCHRSLVKVYLAEIIDALEHMHSHGIVHRDLKPENMLISNTGHIIIIDFGTAKDLVETDLNGIEFVGTPDFMSPEAVLGSSGPTDEEIELANKNKEPISKVIAADHTADLWALGAVAFILQTGQVPFWSPSSYLAFLKIKRGNLYRPFGIADDSAWELIQELMRVEPQERLGADSFQVINKKNTKTRTIKKKEGGYNVLRSHAYFIPPKEKGAPTEQQQQQEQHPQHDLTESNNNTGTAATTKENRGTALTTSFRNVFVGCSTTEKESNQSKAPSVWASNGGCPDVTVIPSLRDLCVRGCADLVRRDSVDLELCDAHPPGDGSSHDMLRLDMRDRKCVMHLLDRLGLLSEPRVYRRFFPLGASSRLDKIRSGTRDYVGLTQMLDNQGQFPSAAVGNNPDPYAEPIKLDPIKFAYLTNPLLVESLNKACEDNATRKRWTKLLKKSIAAINKSRPKVVVASGFVDAKCRKLLAKISDSIPVVTIDGSEYFSFWLSGTQGLALRSKDFLCSDATIALQEEKDERRGGESIIDARSQMLWLSEQLEQSRMSKHPVFVFVDCDPRQLPQFLLKRLARGKTLSIFGLSQGESFSMEVSYEVELGSDNDSVRSTESDEDTQDNHTSKVVGTHDNGLRWISFQDQGEWDTEFLDIEL